MTHISASAAQVLQCELETLVAAQELLSGEQEPSVQVWLLEARSALEQQRRVAVG